MLEMVEIYEGGGSVEQMSFISYEYATMGNGHDGYPVS